MTIDAQQEIPDYQIAKTEMQTILDVLSLKVESSSATDEVSDKHAYLKYTVIINGQSFDYSMGIGHIDWKTFNKSSINYISFTREERSFLETHARKPFCIFYDQKGWANTCAKVANRMKLQPKLIDVISSVLMDATALHMTFEDWCSEFGYDNDSKKAEKIYNACCDNARKAMKFLNRETMEKLTELSQRL
jgi:hypothetical protein